MHPIQYLAYKLLGSRAQQKVVYFLNLLLLYGLSIVGTRLSFTNNIEIPKNVPLIFISNHQSMYDIMGIYWFLRKYRPRFVSKIELAKGIPSISYNLRVSGAALINRKDRKQAISEILKLGSLIENDKSSAIIFPEGTRSRSTIKSFAPGGITGLIKRAPSAYIVCLAIKGSNDLDAYKVYPIKSFQKVSWTVVDTFDPQGMDIEEIIKRSHSAIVSENEG